MGNPFTIVEDTSVVVWVEGNHPFLNVLLVVSFSNALVVNLNNLVFRSFHPYLVMVVYLVDVEVDYNLLICSISLLGASRILDRDLVEGITQAKGVVTRPRNSHVPLVLQVAFVPLVINIPKEEATSANIVIAIA